mgnify:CR=1 FL=1
MQGVPLSFETVTFETFERAKDLCFKKQYLTSQALPEELMGDEVRLKQILINLVKNAFKFTLSGSIRIIVAHDSNGQKLHFHIVDTGKGIK